MPTLAQRLAAIAVLALVGLIVAYLALRAFGVTIGDRPGAGVGVGSSGEASPSSTPAAGSGTPAASDEAPSASTAPSSAPPAEDEIAAIVAEIERQVREVRQLADPGIGPPELMTRDELAAELAASFAEDYPAEEREADNITLRALGLLGAAEDFGELQQRLLTEQVLGFYDDEERRMVIVSDAGMDSLARITYAHEYTHALQDAAFGLGELDLEAAGEDDRSLARLALVEGDATVSMFFWAFQSAPEVMGEIQETPIPETEDVPQWMVDLLAFPYTAGTLFVSELWTTAGPAGVDALYDDLPASTEQILHYDKYVAGEGPMEVAELDLVAALGAGWSSVESTPMGEAQIAILLEHLGSEEAEAQSAASGWGGDRLTVARNGDDVALAWRLAWDRPADANEFSEVYADVAGAVGMSTALEALSDTELLVVHGSSQAVVDAVLAAA